MKKRKRTWRIVPILAAVLTALAVGGCGGAKSAMENGTARDGAYLSETTAAGAYDSGYGEETAAETVADSEGSMGGSGLTGSGELEVPSVPSRKLIRDISMQVETDDFDSLIAALNTKIKELGGYTEESRVDGNSRTDVGVPKYAHITARIPSGRLDGFVTTVEEKGNVLSKTETTTDVTLRYSDIESRKKSLEVEQERLWALLEKADTLEAVIVLEQRLSDIRYELESMGSQLKLYDNQVEYSTVSLDINEVRVYTPVKPETMGERIGRGFTRNLKAMGTVVTDLVIGVLTTSPIWIPVVLIVLVALYVGYQVRKRRAKDGWMPAGQTPGKEMLTGETMTREMPAGKTPTREMMTKDSSGEDDDKRNASGEDANRKDDDKGNASGGAAGGGDDDKRFQRERR